MSEFLVFRVGFYKKSALFNNKEDIGSNPFGHVKSVHSLNAKNIFIVNFYAGMAKWQPRRS